MRASDRDISPARLLTEREAAHLLSISRSTLWRLRREGSLRAISIGRAVRYRERDLIDLIDRSEVAR